MYRYLVFFSCCLTASVTASTMARSCKININTDLATPQPLYLYRNTTDFVTTEPDTSEIHLDAGQQIELFCTNGFVRPYANNGNILIAKCIGGKHFQLRDNKTALLADAACTRYPFHTTRMSNRKCVAGQIVEIGFDINGTWVTTLEICHDNKTGSTKWSHHQLKPNNNNHQRNVARIMFIQGKFYNGIKVSASFARPVQRATMATILGSKEIADQIISNDTELFLARGHLAAKADYVFAPHQLTTFYYINVAPQWQSFNNGNWLQVEIGIKKFIAKRNVDTHVYTGTYGVMTHPDVYGRERKLYLSWSKSGAHQIPVPRFYYKVVIAEEINAGIVLIGINNPYAKLDAIEAYDILCPDVSDQIKYIEWDRRNITAGYSYACSVADFTKVVKDLPKLPKTTKLFI